MESIRLDPSQEAAVSLALRSTVSCIIGGPGTGKSTSLRALLDRFDGTVALAAPTGKAAKRMRETTGRSAQTIHRLLESNGFDGAFNRSELFPVEGDLVVVDESSMMDIEIASALLRSIRPETKLLLMGDANQLPSVGPGSVLRDIVASGVVPVGELTTLHRAAQESWICRNAPTVLAGKVPELDPFDDFLFCRTRIGDRLHAVDLVIEAVCEALPARGVALEDTMVLVPQNVGPLGVDALNGLLQARLNRNADGKKWKIGSDGEVSVGDRVIQTKNDYKIGVYNGEIGEVVAGQSDALTVRFDGRDVEISSPFDLRLAYALTVHRAQGSEAPWVVVVCHSTHAFMLSRPLLYTAITRAKKGVILVGDEKGIRLALKNADADKRNTRLAERIRDGMAKETKDQV